MMKTAKRKSKIRRKKGRGNSRLGRIPAYVLWLSIAFIAVVCVVFVYRTFVGPYSFRLRELLCTVSYPAGTVRGIDVSHYQQDIDWDKLRNASIQGAQVSFIIVKATEGTSILDENFNQNFFRAKKNDIVRGAYHFFSPTSSASDQAKYFCKMVQLDEGDLPPVLDVEQKGNLTPEQLRREVIKWMDIVEKHYGITPILYTGYKFRTSYLNTKEFDKYPFWIAHYYRNELQYKGQWTFWQHTDLGKIDGIKGEVDINVFNGDYQKLKDMTIKTEDNHN